jgi:hypothetical protein
MKYAWIDQQRDSFPIAVMCDVLKVSKSGYYSAQKRTPSPRAERTARIQASVQQVHAQSHGIYGKNSLSASTATSRSDTTSDPTAAVGTVDRHDLTGWCG